MNTIKAVYLVLSLVSISFAPLESARWLLWTLERK